MRKNSLGARHARDTRPAGCRALLRTLLTALLLTLLVTACTPAPKTSIRIGSNVWPGYEPLYLARSLGWLENTGIRLIEYTSTTETMSALRDGSIEAGALTLDEVLTLVQDGVDLRVVLLLDVSNGADAVVAHPGIDNPKDLRGRTIGVEGTAVGGYMIDRMLEQGGLTLSEVTILPILLDAHEAAFLEHRADAIVTFEPVKSHLIALGGQVLFDSSMIPGEIIDVLAVRSEIFQSSPLAFDALIETWYKALDYLQQHPDDAMQRMQPRLRLSPEQLGQLYAELQLGTASLNRSFFDNAKNPPVKKTEKLIAAMLRNKLLMRKPDVSHLFAAPAERRPHGRDGLNQ